MTDAEKYNLIDQLYAMLPELKCKKLCAEVCGVIPMSPLEKKRIEETYPGVVVYDALNVIKEVSRGDMRHRDCSLLDKQTGTCTVYDVRPLICRMFGVVDDERMRCEHGCVPDEWLKSNTEMFIISEMDKLSPHLGLNLSS